MSTPIITSRFDGLFLNEQRQQKLKGEARQQALYVKKQKKKIIKHKINKKHPIKAKPHGRAQIKKGKKRKLRIQLIPIKKKKVD